MGVGCISEGLPPPEASSFAVEALWQSRPAVSYGAILPSYFWVAVGGAGTFGL